MLTLMQNPRVLGLQWGKVDLLVVEWMELSIGRTH